MIKNGFIIAALLFITPSAFAYVGPGFAGGVVTATLGLIAAIFMLLFGVIWYPLKKLYKRFRATETTK